LEFLKMIGPQGVQSRSNKRGRCRKAYSRVLNLRVGAGGRHLNSGGFTM